MMTEVEARGKRCCNPKSGDGIFISYCLASECMAWRWCPERHSGRTADGTVILTHGYCGLAGKP